MKLCVYTIVATILFLSPVLVVHAQTPCGNIIGPENFVPVMSAPTVTIPVSNCDDPFNVTNNPISPYTLMVDTVEYPKGGIVPVVDGKTNQIAVKGDPELSGYYLLLFKHDGNDYRYVNMDAPEAGRADFAEYAVTYFESQATADRYMDIYDAFVNNGGADNYFYDNDGNQIIDGSTGEPVSDRYYAFTVSFYNQFVPKRPIIEAGTYTLFIKEYLLTNTYRTPIKRFADLTIPTAHAAPLNGAGYPENRYTITFTLTESVPEPTGASSVLFLPGIQASRLYLGDGVEVSDKLWEPGENTDVRLLSLNQNGESIIDVRTNDIVDEVGTNFLGLGTNVYKGFISFMNNLVDDEVISEWVPFAYDWRKDVFDIVENGTKYRDDSIRNPVDEVIRLAEDSLSGKVTIIAHSNGGLLAKAVTLELEERGKGSLVDKVIFIGTPQLGTPKAIGTILHGYDQEALGGLIIDDGIAREVIKNLPGVYSLLPSEKYIQNFTGPLVTFDNSSITQSLRNSYGSAISDLSELNAFMVGIEDSLGRGSVAIDEVNKPSLVNADLYFDAQINHKLKLDSWSPATTTEVIQIIGTGLPTMKSIEYREITENKCKTDENGITSCVQNKIIKPLAKLTLYGDETVVSDSASYSPGDSSQKYYFDLDKVKEGLFNLKKSHSDLTEAEQLQDFVKNILKTGSSSEVRFISNTQPTFSKLYDIEEINSPVQISAQDTSGRVTGMVKDGGQWMLKQEIPDSSYFEFGGTKYLIIPSTLNRTTTLVGEAQGGYSLTLSTLSGETQTKKHQIVNATTTPTMVATYNKKDGQYSTIKTDYNDDRVDDYENTVDGVTVVPLPLYTYSNLIEVIDALQIKRVHKDALLVLAREAEKLDKKSSNPLFAKLEKATLKILEAAVLLYKKNKLITNAQADELLIIIRFLSK